MSQYQDRYWNQLKEFKVHVNYLQRYATKSDKADKTINIFLAITSSSSIAAWAIWQEYQMIWAIIIALSQIITAIKPILPYKQRLKAVNGLNNMLQKVALDCERKWYAVAEGLLTEHEIHDACFDFKNLAREHEQKYFQNMVLPVDQTLLKEAEEETDLYLQQNYS